MEKIIVGNQKNYMTIKEVKNFLDKMKQNKNESVIVCPSSLYVPYYLKRNFKVGIQNITESDIVCTGEINVEQIKALDINYVIVGHSERRHNLDETDKLINKKIKLLLNENIIPILCIGETYKFENNSYTEQMLKNQLINDLEGIQNTEKIIIAYEPVWSIGTGLIPSSEEIKKTIDFIRSIIKNEFISSKIQILYGGSVNSKNINELKEIEGLDGFLIGKSSTDPDEFLKIINALKQDDK